MTNYLITIIWWLPDYCWTTIWCLQLIAPWQLPDYCPMTFFWQVEETICSKKLKTFITRQCPKWSNPHWGPFLYYCYGSHYDNSVGQWLKVRKSQNYFFQVDVSSKKWTNEVYFLWNLRATCFDLFFGGNGRHQKDISKLSDL